jgi:hypothetical protein
VTAGGSIDVGNTISYSVVSANGKNQAAPLLTYLNVSSDLATSLLTFYTLGTPVQVRYTNSTTTLFIEGTNGVTTNAQIIVIRHADTDTYERRITTGSTATTNLIVTSAPSQTVRPGDLIYQMTGTNTIPWIAGTNSIGPGPGIYAGQAGKPLLFEINGTAACQINAWCATYPQ